MADARVGIIIEAQDRATRTINDVAARLDDINKNFERQARASRQFAVGITAAAAAVGGFGIAALKAAAGAEQTKVAFETMLGSAENADVFIKQLVNFAKTTPFELKGLEQASKQLLAYGFAQEEVIPNLKSIGDIAAGVGMDKLPNLIMAFGQVKAATRLTGMELRQFTEAGVPLLDMLAKQFGKPVSAIQEMVSAGEVGFPAVQEALRALTGEGGRFNDLMNKQAKTLGGLWSNLKDAWDIFLREQGAKLIEWAKQFTNVAINFVQNVLPVWIDRVDKLTKFFAEHKVAIYIVAGAIIGGLVPAVYAAAVAFAAAAIALAPFLIGGAIVGALVAGIVWVVKNWDGLKETAIFVWTAIKDFIGGIVDAINEKIQGWLDRLKAAWEFTWLFLKEFAANMLGLLVGSILTTLDFFFPQWQERLNMVINFFITIWTAAKDFLVGLWNSIVEYYANIILAFVDVAKPVLDKYLKFWKAIWDAVKEVFMSVWTSIKEFFQGVIDFIVTNVSKAVSAIEKILRPLREAAELSGKVFKSVGSKVSDGFSSVIERGKGLLGLADGGLVTRPTLAMIGEGGEPEAVIPLSKLRGMGGGITININGGNYLDRDAGLMLGDQIIQVLRQNMRI